MKSNIDELIERSGLRRNFIANELGVSTKQLKNIATGHSWPDPPKMFILSELLGVELNDLYSIEEN